MPADWEENLFRIAQECLTNVLRHARASSVNACIRFDEDAVRIQFDDDGQGFDPAAQSEGYGLMGMRERVGAMGGRMEVESSRGIGTTISICLPLPGTPASEPN
jgi:signal transduction histidine kinase